MGKDIINAGKLLGIANLGCVAALQCKGFEVVEEKRNGHVYFFFEKDVMLNGDKFEDVLNDYLNDKLMVRANTYNAKLDYIKAHIFNKEKNV